MKGMIWSRKVEMYVHDLKWCVKVGLAWWQRGQSIDRFVFVHKEEYIGTVKNVHLCFSPISTKY